MCKEMPTRFSPIHLFLFQKYFEPAQDHAFLPLFLPNEYISEENTHQLDYMREFQGPVTGVDSTATTKQLIFKTDPDEGETRENEKL